MLLTGLPVDALGALDNGLVTDVHEPDALLDAAVALAGRIASRAPLSVEATKRVASRAIDMDAKAAAASNVEEIAILSASEDHAGAVAAFAERREPVFRRR
jgi:enoyl-CoA hydratase